jgi:hypothetical protein
VKFGWTLLISRDERTPFGAIGFAPKIDTLLEVADGTNARRWPGERNRVLAGIYPSASQ